MSYSDFVQVKAYYFFSFLNFIEFLRSVGVFFIGVASNKTLISSICANTIEREWEGKEILHSLQKGGMEKCF